LTEEVKRALFSAVGDMKAMGSNSLCDLIFQTFLEFIGVLNEEVWETINNKVVRDSWNDAIIVLIPKTESLEKLPIVAHGMYFIK
jgi:hypothetical protein